MQPRVYTHYPLGETKRHPRIPAFRVVKNLGWILRHASEVEHISVYNKRLDYAAARFAAVGTHRGTNLEYTFLADFGSYDIAKRFANRPCFYRASKLIELRQP